MKMKQKGHCFAMWSHKANAGFTLVELIVVIAILAILGGVAVPAYSGYVEKAEYAADEALLAELNTAFAAACAISGENHVGRDDTSATITDKKADVTASGISGFDAAFDSFYEGGEFQKMTQLYYSPDDGRIVADINQASGDVLVSYNGIAIRVSKEAIAALKDSSFYGEGMTSEKLLQQIDNVAVIANGMGTIQNIMGTPEFGAFALSALGLPADANLETEAQKLILQKLGWTQEEYDSKINTDEGFALYTAAQNQIMGNALILYTAQQTTNMGNAAKDLLTDINSTTISQNMYGATAEQQQTGVNQAALAYGMYYAYVNSDACTDSSIKGNSNITPNDVISALDNNTEFKTYMESEQGTKDMEAYLEALSVINNGAQNPGAVENLLTNGFVDLNDLLTDTMGQ